MTKSTIFNSDSYPYRERYITQDVMSTIHYGEKYNLRIEQNIIYGGNKDK